MIYPRDDLLSHGIMPHYHRRCAFLRLCSEWEEVVPTPYGHGEDRNDKCLMINDKSKLLSFFILHLSLFFICFKFLRNWPISIARLNALRRLQLQPINVVISHGPSGNKFPARPNLGVYFELRCFQLLSRPNIATQRCPWQDSWYTRGLFFSVLSY